MQLLHTRPAALRRPSPAGLALTDGDILYLRWQTNDVAGSGARDEIGLDTIVVIGHQIIFEDGFESGDSTARSEAVGLIPR